MSELPPSTVKVKSKSKVPDLQCLSTTTARSKQPLTKGHNRLRRNHKIPQPSGWTHPCAGTSRAAGRTQAPGQRFALGTALTQSRPQLVAATGAPVQRNSAMMLPQENEMGRPRFRAASETREKWGFLVRSWASTTPHFPCMSSRILK